MTAGGEMKDVIEAMAAEASKLHGMIGPGCDWDYEQLIRAALSAALERGWKLVPVEATEGLLVSMAMRFSHDFGIPKHPFGGFTPDERRALMGTMKQLHEEVVGSGFYSPEKEESYRAMIAASPEVK